jgi:hypothetical protein
MGAPESAHAASNARSHNCWTIEEVGYYVALQGNGIWAMQQEMTLTW